MVHGKEEVSFQLFMDGMQNLFAKGMMGVSSVDKNESGEVMTLKKGFV